MKTTIEDRDLTKQAPHSPCDRFGDFAIIGRTVDKCRALISGQLGEYHYDCPLDNQLFGFKGIDGDQFKTVVSTSQNYEDVATWLQSNGTRKTAEEVRAWSDKVEAAKLMDVFAKHDQEEVRAVTESCRKMGLDFNSATLFEWLEADDRASFEPHAHAVAH